MISSSMTQKKSCKCIQQELSYRAYLQFKFYLVIMHSEKKREKLTTRALYQQDKKQSFIYQQNEHKQNNVNQSNFQKASNYKLIKKSIGVIKASWFNQKNQLLTFVYGTAFHVTSTIIMTCTHNIYSNFRKRFADRVEFFANLLPNQENGDVQKVYEILKRQSIDAKKIPYRHIESFFQNFFTNEDLSTQEAQNKLNFQYQPKRQEITLIRLKLKNPQQFANKGKIGIPIGRLQQEDIHSQTKLMIIGYPSDSYRSMVDFKNAYVKRKQLFGKYHSIECYKNNQGEQRMQILNYTLMTSYGFSGSPVLAFDQKKNRIYAIGIHTHRGKSFGYNSGVYFSKQFLMAIRQFQIRLRQRLQEASQSPIDSNKEVSQIQFLQQNDRQEILLSRQVKQINPVFDEKVDENSRSDSDSFINSLIQSYSQNDQEQENSHISNGDIDVDQKQQVSCRENSHISNEDKDIDIDQKQQVSQSCSSCSEMSEMSDLGMLDYFTLVKDEEERSYNGQSKEFTIIQGNPLIVQNYHLFMSNQLLRMCQGESNFKQRSINRQRASTGEKIKQNSQNIEIFSQEFNIIIQN